MTEAADTKKEVQETLDKLHKKTTVTETELKNLQQHIDILERAAQGSHHHHDDSKLL